MSKKAKDKSIEETTIEEVVLEEVIVEPINEVHDTCEDSCKCSSIKKIININFDEKKECLLKDKKKTLTILGVSAATIGLIAGSVCIFKKRK